MKRLVFAGNLTVAVLMIGLGAWFLGYLIGLGLP